MPFFCNGNHDLTAIVEIGRLFKPVLQTKSARVAWVTFVFVAPGRLQFGSGRVSPLSAVCQWHVPSGGCACSM